jgi:hypothetical protein
MHVYLRLLALRQHCRALHQGAWTSLGVRDGVLAYARGDPSKRVAMLLNFGATDATLGVDMLAYLDGHVPCVWLSTALDRSESLSGPVTLRPREGLIVGTAELPRACLVESGPGGEPHGALIREVRKTCRADR